LREYIPDESVDLVYLDPTFNSNRNYNVLSKDQSGKEVEAQMKPLKIHGIGVMLLRKPTMRAD
jgi:hypothetical protein